MRVENQGLDGRRDRVEVTALSTGSNMADIEVLKGGP